MMKFNPAKIGNSRQAQGVYNIQNRDKYIGSNPPIYRSSWEKDFMITCDNNPAIFEWAVEPFPIPYICPFDRIQKNYFPDFIIKYVQADGTIKSQIIEIKPYKQTNMEAAKGKKAKMMVQVNLYKWAYAQKFCEDNGLEFKVLTEKDLYKK